MPDEPSKVKQGQTKQNTRGLRCSPLSRQSVDTQARIAIVLLALIPALACFYIGGVMSGPSGQSLPPLALTVFLLCTGIAAFSGYLILRKYARSIGKLRRYIMDIAEGSLPGSIRLEQSADSDDLRCIEDGLNTILREIEHRMHLIEDKLQTEYGLRKELERQQEVLIDAERHRVMMQSLGAACHHLGQPATALRLRLYLLKERARNDEEAHEIDCGIRDLEAIESVLRKLREVNEYRTVPYLPDDECDENRILAI